MATRTVKLGSLAPGVNNRLAPTELQTVLPDRSRGTFLYGADNVDIGDKGGVSRRRGLTRVVAGVVHSLWSDKLAAFGVVNNVLSRLTSAGAQITTQALLEGMPLLAVSYSRGADGDVYYTNGQSIARLTAMATKPIATVEPQNFGGSAFQTIDGSLPAGRYLIALTNIDENGESPATPVTQLDLPVGGGIYFDPPAHVYMSAPNGDILSYQGFTSTISSYDDTGRTCPTLNTARMPAGQIVRHYNGRMLVAAGSVLYYSLPYNYGLYDAVSGYLPLPGTITVVEPTDNAIYICADKTYWIGDLLTDKLQEILPYGGIAGSSGRSPEGDDVFWQSERGLIVADRNQNIKNVQEDVLKFSGAVSGASLFREQNGATHIVTSRAGAQPVTASASSYIEADIIRKGTVL